MAREGVLSLIIAVDVDGVVADLHAEWLRLYNEEYDDSLTCEDLTEWHIHKLVKPECGERIYAYLHLPTLYDRVRPFEGALRGITNLRAAGHRVFYATSCVMGGMVDAKAEWMVRNGFIKGSKGGSPDFVAVNDKSLIRADLLIDDYPKNLDDFKGYAALLMSRPWNRHAAPPARDHGLVLGWEDVANEVKFVGANMRGSLCPK